MSNEIWFDPTSNKWVLSDGEHYLEVPYWARKIIADEFERENAELKAENAHLWESVQNAEHEESVAWDRVRSAERRNDKLRELVRDAWGDGHPDRSCDGCDIRDECHDDVERMRKDGMLRFSRCLFEVQIEQRMRELGIEVDE